VARFDVYRLQGSTALLLDIHADLFLALGSRVIFPLTMADQAAREGLPNKSNSIDPDDLVA